MINSNILSDFGLGLLYGFIQGISEFIPVSSSGHLAILPIIGEFKDPGVAFDLMMHLGTALAVIIYFYKDIKNIASLFFQRIFGKTQNNYGLNFFLATCASGIFACLVKDFAQANGRSSHFIAVNLIVFGLILFLADIYAKKSELKFSQKEATFASLAIGLMQVLAIFPGVSRSGITLTGARFFGASREEASSFSFLLSLPLIIGGAALKVIEMKKGEFDFSFVMCLTGFLVSTIVGYLTIHYFMKLIKRISFFYFFLYRLFLGVLILIFI